MVVDLVVVDLVVVPFVAGAEVVVDPKTQFARLLKQKKSETQIIQ